MNTYAIYEGNLERLEKISQDTEHAEGTFNLDEVLEVFNS